MSARSAVRSARIGPVGGGVSPKRFRSAFENGRSQAKALPATNQVRLPCRAASVTSGSAAIIRSTSSRAAMGARYRYCPRHDLFRLVVGLRRRGGTGTGWTTDPDYGLTGIVLSTRTMTSPEPPAHMVEFSDAACERWPLTEDGFDRPRVR